MSRNHNLGRGYMPPGDDDAVGLDLHEATLRLPADGPAGTSAAGTTAAGMAVAGTTAAGTPAAAGTTGTGRTAAAVEAGDAADTPRRDLPVPVGAGIPVPRDAGPGAGVDLTEDPFGDDLAAELAARAPRRLATRSTLTLAGLVLLIAGFIGGALVQKNFGTTGAGGNTSAAARAARAGAFAGGAFGGAFGTGRTGTGGASAAPSTTGTVKLVDGGTVYIQTAAGQVLTVKTNSSTPVQISGSLKDLKPGTTITVTGPTSSDGTVTAARISQGG